MLRIDGATRMAAVVANPIKHSLSPLIHNRAFELTGENGIYLAWEVAEADLAQTLANIRLLGMYGVNLSMPYKQLAMWYVNDLSEEAKLIGAINTIVNTDGKLVGHNTDGIGFFRALSADGFDVTGRDMTILGGGGAAMALIATAAIQHATAIHVFARQSASYGPLEEKCARVSQLTGTAIDVTDLHAATALQQRLDATDLLVNATSLGMDGKSMPLDVSCRVADRTRVCDVIYKVAQTPFLRWAASQGAVATNGLGMLLYQAAEAFKLWTGQPMPVEPIAKELSKKLSQN